MKIFESYAKVLYPGRNPGISGQDRVAIGNSFRPVILYNVYEFDWEKEKSFIPQGWRSLYLLPLWKDTRNI